MSFDALFRYLFIKRPKGAETQRDYVTIDSAGRARFDVATYVASEEGAKRVKAIAQANRSVPRTVAEK
jgi:hypothetical protein